MPLPLYLLALAVFAMGTSEFMLAGLLPDIATSFSVPVGAAGLLISIFAAGMIIGAPLMAMSARRLPPRASLLGFVSLFAVAHVLGALTPSFTVLLITRLAAALANAGFLAVALSSAVTMVATDHRARALAVLLSGTTVATVAGVPGGALLGTLFDWRATFWAIALLCLPAAVGIARGLPSSSPDRPSSVDAPAAPSLRTEIGQLRAPGLILTMLLGAMINGATFAGYTFLAPIVTETAGLSRPWVPAALVIFGIGSTIGVTIGGRLADRHSAAVIIGTAPLLVAGWLAMMLLAAHPAALLILILVQGMLSFGLGSTVIARVLQEAGDAPTLGGAYATLALNVGAAGGPLAGSAALTTSAEAVGPIGVSAVLAAAALPVIGRLLRPGRRPG